MTQTLSEGLGAAGSLDVRRGSGPADLHISGGGDVFHLVAAAFADVICAEMLVSGHGMYRMLGFLSVSADDLVQLEAASGEIDSLAQRSQLEVARLSGEHDQAFGAAALPLARGLR